MPDLEWKLIRDINKEISALNTTLEYQNDLLKGTREIDIYIPALGHLYISCNKNDTFDVLIKPSYYMNQNYNACATVLFNSNKGIVKLILLSKGNSDQFSDFKLQAIRYR